MKTVRVFKPQKIGSESSSLCSKKSSHVEVSTHRKSHGPSLVLGKRLESTAAKLLPFYWYEGPEHPFNYTNYNGMGCYHGLWRPLYLAPADVTGTARRHYLLVRIHALLLAQFAVINFVLMFFLIWPTITHTLLRYRGIRISSICIVAILTYWSIFFSIWRRETVHRAIVAVIFALACLYWAVCVTSPATVLDNVISYGTNCVTFFFATLFCLQNKIDLSGILGIFIVIGVHVALDSICIILYYFFWYHSILSNVNCSMFSFSAVVWVLYDSRRWIYDENRSLAEQEYLFAYVQIAIDLLYLPKLIVALLKKVKHRVLNRIHFGDVQKLQQAARAKGKPGQKLFVVRKRITG